MKSWIKHISARTPARTSNSTRKSSIKNIGREGERHAAQYLRRKGYRIISLRERDFLGELDIIAFHRSSSTLVFVEVKTLRSSKPGHPADKVDFRKQQKITRAALRYLKRRNLLGTRARFDVISIRWPYKHDQPSELSHFISAFEASENYQMF